MQQEQGSAGKRSDDEKAPCTREQETGTLEAGRLAMPVLDTLKSQRLDSKEEWNQRKGVIIREMNEGRRDEGDWAELGEGGLERALKAWKGRPTRGGGRGIWVSHIK